MERYGEKMYIAFMLGYDILNAEFDDLNLTCDNAFEFSLEIADWFLKSEFNNPNKNLYSCLQEFVVYYTAERSDRYEACKGYNTKQWWIYDTEDEMLIDPPAVVCNMARKIELMVSCEAASEFIERVVFNEPDWLFDEDHRYDGEMEI